MNNPVESEEKQEKKKENSNFQQEHEKSLGLISQLVRYAPTGGSLWILGSFIKEQDWLSTLITFPLMVIMVAWSAYSKSFLLKIQERMKERGKEDADSLMAQFQKLDSAIKEAIKWQLAGVEDKYLKSQGNACLYYTTEGSQSTFKPLLKDVFIPLELSGDFFRDSTGEDIPTPRGYQWDKQLIIESQKDGLTIWDIFKRLPKNSAYRNLAILAWGGYGKTTLLRHIAYTYAKKKLPRGVPKLLPVLLLLRKWQRVIAEEKPDLTVLIEEHHIPSLPEGKNFKRPKNWAKNLLSQNKFLIMFDGFDEVKEEWRESVSKWLGQMMHNYPGAYFILTSRPAGYKSYKPENKPNTLRLKAFNEEQRERFINKWYLSRERQISAEPDNPVVKQTAEQKSANLVKQLKERSELNDLAKNPLLLNMIVNLHSVAPTDTSDLSRPIQLPQRRTELYREIFRLQLGDRPLVKQINMCFDADEAQQILQDFALYMVKENKSNIDDKQLKGQVEKPIHKLDESIEADLFIKQIVEVSELLVKKDENYEFSHLSFQGYLAAKEIIRTEQEDLLINNWDKSWWRETILLYGAQVNPSNLIRNLLQQKNQDAAILAKEIIKESPRKIDPQIEAEIQNLEQSVSKLLYEQLENYLKNGQWQKADRETYRLMTLAMGKEEDQLLDSEDFLNFPCEDLRTINQLWLKYSNGKFGFSVQKEIYESLGGTREYNYETWKNFCNSVGWRKGEKWLSYNQLTFNLNALKAHLPRPPVPGKVVRDIGGSIRVGEMGCSFFQRLVTCSI